MVCAPSPLSCSGGEADGSAVSGSSAGLFKSLGKTKWYPRGGGGEALLWVPTLPVPYCLCHCPPSALPAPGQVVGPLVAAVQHLCQGGRSCLLRAPSSNSDRWTSANRFQMPSPGAERVLAGRLGHRAALDFSSPVGSSHILPLPPLFKEQKH